MTESSCCSCDRKKRKYFYFKKKPGKVLNTADSEKIIQTIEPDYADKADQTSSKQNLVHASTSDSKVTTNNDTQVKMITVCSKCGKISDSHCKRCCKACTKNTIVLPPKPLISGDQADTLKTLIKMEAKQNYRQVNIILQELNDQKSEIKKLIDLYQGLSKNVSGNKLDKTSSTTAKKRDYVEDSPLQRPQTVNICEGCGLHFYRTSLLENVRGERCEHRPAVTTGKALSDEQQATQDTDNNKKYPKRNKSKTSKDQANIQVGEKGRASEASTFTEQPPAELQIPTRNPEKPTSNTATQYEKYYTEYERIGTSKTDTEKSSKIAENPSDDKPADQCQTRSMAFLRWWKKSCTSLKERESKHVKQCSKYMMEKNREESQGVSKE
ncbi:hypothetical protein NQ318_006794 [Aromia moschata]|uniref:Uncharacterized protein n=1 Tax=Aromia moschata TaxID=1265417 RepID=A0AAV8XT33_9CUCU|nr:hypothetical protein NQ318_006794 [Aromia moschata]